MTTPTWLERYCGKGTQGLFIRTSTRGLVDRHDAVVLDVGQRRLGEGRDAEGVEALGFTASAVSGVPSWKVTPSRIVMVHIV